MRQEDLLNVDYIRSRLDYDPETGLLRWKAIPVTRPRDRAWNTEFAGTVAGMVSGGGHRKDYVRIFLDGKQRSAHQLAWLIATGEWPPREIDHIDGCGTNNAFSNLRLVTANQNHWNEKRQSNNSSGFKGVGWVTSRGKWRASIIKNRQYYSLGHYHRLEDAVEARRKAAAELHGDYAGLNGDADQ